MFTIQGQRDFNNEDQNDPLGRKPELILRNYQPGQYKIASEMPEYLLEYSVQASQSLAEADLDK